MTKWQEFPIRPQGRPWVGINTRSGKLDDGSGQMTDNSIGMIINRADRLEKRKGLVRGLDERFGTVCGLHKYTDECGREFLLVADEGGFSIRQPFAIPSFAASDAYPSDSFQSDGPVNTTTWRNSSLYTQLGGSLLLDTGQLNGGDMAWFKDASNFSYELAMDYALAGDSVVVGIIKSSTGQARIEARVTQLAGNVVATMVWIDFTGAEVTLGTLGLGVLDAGDLVLSYERNTTDSVFTVQLVVTPESSGAVTAQDFTTLNALNDADFGQGSELRIERTLATTAPAILSVQGAPV